jgi:hypothetical protein
MSTLKVPEEPMKRPHLVAALIAVFFATTTVLGAQTGSTPTSIKFLDAPVLPCGESPVAVAVADFNHDGKPDFVVANNFSSNVEVFLNAGKGKFTSTVYPTGTNPNTIGIADLNNDGLLDLAVTNRNGVSILLGNGNGTFQSAKTYPATLPNQIAQPTPIGLGIGDFNRDGFADLMVADSVNNTINFLSNDGTGAFKVIYNITQYTAPRAFAVGDFNHDGNLDFTVAKFSGASVSVFLGKGDGSFQNGVNYTTASAPWSVSTADVNGDGILDLLVPDSHGVDLFLGNGDGTFGPLVNLPEPLAEGLTVADFNRDGILDLVLTTTAGVTFIPGKGNATFGPGTTYATGSSPVAAVVADFDGDGKMDAIVPNSNSNNLTLLKGVSNGLFHAAPAYALPAADAITIGDVNGDGIPDTLVDDGFGSVLVYLGKSNGTLRQVPIQNVIGTVYSGALALADFNHDGKMDLVVANDAFANISVALGNGNGTFRTPVVYPTGFGASAIRIADYNNDGYLDIAVGGYEMVTILFGQQDGTFMTGETYLVGLVPEQIVAGDFNGDGAIDLAVAAGSAISVLLGNGDGSFQTATYNLANSPTGLASVDLNHDGKLDLVATVEFNNFFSVLFGNGDGTFRQPVNVPTDTPEIEVAAIDANHDGNIDLVFSNPIEVTIFPGKGNGHFGAPLNFLAGNNPGQIGTADLNRDGWEDIVVLGGNGVAGGAQSLAVLLNTE